MSSKIENLLSIMLSASLLYRVARYESSLMLSIAALFDSAHLLSSLSTSAGTVILLSDGEFEISSS